MSILLVANLPLIALKFKSYALKENIDKYSLLLISVLSLILLGIKAIPLIIASYVIISIIFSRKNHTS